MKRLLLIIALVIPGFYSLAQHTVSGIIIDSNDQTLLLEGVKVFIPELNKSDLSKEGGTYLVTNVGIGTIHIQFSKPGYKTEIKTISTKDSAVVVNVFLEKSILAPDEFSYSSFSSVVSSNSFLPTANYSAVELAKSGTLDPISSLSYKPGLDVFTNGNNNIHLSIRGSGLERVSYYMENVKLEATSWDDKYSPGINVNGTKDYEVVSGPASLLYGDNSSSGVLVMHEERADITGRKSGDVKMKFNINTLGLNFEAGFKGNSNNGLFYSLRFGGESHTSYIQGTGNEVKLNTEERPFASNSKFNSQYAKLILGLNKKWGMSKVSFSHLTQNNGLIQYQPDVVTLANGVERDRTISIPNQKVNSELLSSSSTILIGKSKLNVDLSYQSNKDETNEYNLSGITENTDAFDLSAQNFNVRYSSDQLQKFSYTIGTQGGMKKLSNKGVFSRMPDSKVSDLSAFVLVNYDLKKLHLQAGGRYDSKMQDLTSYNGKNDTSSLRPNVKLSNKYNLASGSLGVTYQATKIFSVRANASSGFCTPNELQLASYAVHAYTDRFEVGSMKLVPEKNLQIDLSTKIELPVIAFELKGYSNMIKDYIYTSYSGSDTIIPVDSNSTDTFKVFGFTQSDAKISGLEFSVTINPPAAKWFKLDLSYGMMNGKFTKGGYLPFIPTNKLVGAITISGEKLNYVYKPFLSFVARNYFERKNIASFEYTNEAYALLDFQIGGSFRWGKQYFDLEVSINNLLNTNYVGQFSSLRSLNQNGIYDMGRNVSIQLHIPFGLNK